jgi:hypothetical protein
MLLILRGIDLMRPEERSGAGRSWLDAFELLCAPEDVDVNEMGEAMRAGDWRSFARWAHAHPTRSGEVEQLGAIRRAIQAAAPRVPARDVEKLALAFLTACAKHGELGCAELEIQPGTPQGRGLRVELHGLTSGVSVARFFLSCDRPYGFVKLRWGERRDSFMETCKFKEWCAHKEVYHACWL